VTEVRNADNVNSKTRPTDEVACTIVANNYVAAARCFTKSFLKHHPDGLVYVLLVDRPGDVYVPEKERLTTVTIEELGIPKLLDMVLRYDLLELCTAVKPYFLEYLFKKYNHKMVCYFDPDIYIYDYLGEIWNVLENHSIALTPHLLGPVDETHEPNEIHILKRGTFNLGFIGLSSHSNTRSFLEWWKNRLTRQCFSDEEGLFLDQKWINLVPGYYSDVAVVRHPGYNVGYWDLTNRRVERVEDRYFVNDLKLGFYHFSGFSPDKPQQISKYQNRHTFDEQRGLLSLFKSYAECLFDMGFDETRNIPNALIGSLEESHAIRDFRKIWRQYEFEHSFKWNADPTENGKMVEKLLAWLNTTTGKENEGNCLTRVAAAVYDNNAYLRQRYPEAYSNDEIIYAVWFIRKARQREKIPRVFIAGMRKSLLRRFFDNPKFVLQGVVRYMLMGLRVKQVS